MSGKYALVIGNTEYADPGLSQLSAPGTDVTEFVRVLKDPKLCEFDKIDISLNQISSSVIETIDDFFDQKKPDDLLVLYFSGHGIRDESGSLYLAFKNTIRSRLRSTAVKADYIREAMDQSRSKRQVLILDCCNSGAFPQGTKAEVGGAMGLVTAFQGYGRYVLTASDATQFAWEGNRVIGKTENSLFTHFLVRGLEGEADNDGDGRITVDDLYHYAFEEISKVIPNQTPTKSASKQAGEIVLRQITRMEDIKAISLPDELTQALADSRTFVREGAVQQLEKLLHGKNLGWVRSAKEALEKLAAEDDSYRVRQVAAGALGSLADAPHEIEKERLDAQETASRAPQEIRQERLASEIVEAKDPRPAAISGERPVKVDQRRLIMGGIGVLIVLVVIAAAALSLLKRGSANNKPNAPLAIFTSSPPAASSLPVASSLPTGAPSLPVTASLQAASTLPAAILAGGHLVKPAEVALAPMAPIYDTDSSGTGPQGRAPYGDSYLANRFERPFLKNMTYVPDLDILSFNLSQDKDWDYVSIQLAGNNPNNSAGIDYGVEIDLNDDGFGDYLIWARPPYTAQWDTSTVQVLKDSNHDTAAWSNSSVAASSGNGYDAVVFDGSSNTSTDPDLAWVRMEAGAHASIQFAFKKSGIGSSFLWGAVADAGLKDVSKFDYRNLFTQAVAGSPVRSSQYYPLGSLYGVDNTCWEANSIRTTGSEPKICPAVKQVITGKGGGGSACDPAACPNGVKPGTCLCRP